MLVTESLNHLRMPGVSKEGSLANEKLISDATAGLEKIIGRSVYDAESLKFVIQQLVGKTDALLWREMWIAKTSESQTQFLMIFKEVGLGTAVEIYPRPTECSTIFMEVSNYPMCT